MGGRGDLEETIVEREPKTETTYSTGSIRRHQGCWVCCDVRLREHMLFSCGDAYLSKV
jgi:hypothetical protein